MGFIDWMQREATNHHLRVNNRLLKKQLQLQKQEQSTNNPSQGTNQPWAERVAEDKWRKVLEKLTAGEELSAFENRVLWNGHCPEHLKDEFSFNPETKRVEPKIVSRIERADDI